MDYKLSQGRATKSGTSSSPNLQSVNPRTDTWLKLDKCFIPPDRLFWALLFEGVHMKSYLRAGHLPWLRVDRPAEVIEFLAGWGWKYIDRGIIPGPSWNWWGLGSPCPRGGGQLCYRDINIAAISYGWCRSVGERCFPCWSYLIYILSNFIYK